MISFDNISLLQIEVFLNIADCKNLTKAAKNLYISQSAASRWIQKLETSLNTSLFVRTNRGIMLTDDGKYLYQQLKPLFNRMKMTLHNTRSAYIVTDNVIRVGCLEIEEVFDEMIVIVKKFEKMYPDISVVTRFYDYQNLRENLISDNLDCVFGFSQSLKELQNTDSKYFKHMDTYFAIPASFEAAQPDVPYSSGLAGKDLYLYPMEKMKAAEQRAVNICKAHGFTPNQIKYVSERLALETAINDGNGFTIAGPGFGLRFGSAIHLHKVEMPLEEEQYMIIAWSPTNCSDAVKRFIDFVPDLC